jgi:predicted  nucleic acid-binding Zn-ribbon protein
MSALATLLELQEHDVKLDQLRHRRASLPDRAEHATRAAVAAALAREIAEVEAERATVAREQKRLEDAVALVVDKAKAEDKKLYSGTVTAPKELQAIQDELASLDRRRNSLEDDIIVQMELAEPLDESLAASRERQSALETELAGLAERIGAAEQVIDDEAAVVQGERESLAAQVDAALLREYEELRRRLGGIAVARLEGSSCRGCHLQLAAVELDRIRKLDRDAVVHCDECGRILVR